MTEVRASTSPETRGVALASRRHEPLETAYRAGCFHGKELDVGKRAKELGMSISTYHLRLASHQVLQHVLGRTEP